MLDVDRTSSQVAGTALTCSLRCCRADEACSFAAEQAASLSILFRDLEASQTRYPCERSNAIRNPSRWEWSYLSTRLMIQTKAQVQPQSLVDYEVIG
jgi:hypothetical protein